MSASPAAAAAPTGRVAQRRRTRKAIVDAAIRLLARGSDLTADAVAAEADVSRRTVYLHFPSLDQLSLDAALGAISTASVEGAVAASVRDDDVHAGPEALIRALYALPPETLALGRKIIRLTVDPPDGIDRPRGFRRAHWIEQAVEPLRSRLSAPEHDRLVSALSVVIGFEAMIVLRDVRGLADSDAADLSVAMACALVDRALG